MKKDKKLKNELYFIAGALIVAAIAFIIIHRYKMISTENASVVIEVDGRTVATYPLCENRIVEIDSYNGGSNIVSIKEGKVSVSEASCPDKICVKHKAIKYNGESIICLPNRMTVTIVAGSSETDGKTY
ncbi:MAG: NusG domain II-containing protein [Lachnospiraceae bacterium]|nr:NusG domain II-containing protein [Lachnospiraceae bacterium]